MIFDAKILITTTVLFLGASHAYFSDLKDPGYIDDAFMRDIISDILAAKEKDSIVQDEPEEYVDDEIPYGLNDVGRAMMARTVKNQNERLMDYDFLMDQSNPNPSLRDAEHIQNSALWHYQMMSGGGGEGPYVKTPQVKTDAKLPAYCNPPNPCPVGYSEDQGCINDFENTASFSREYQSAQECMCDTEHMFECPASGQPGNKQNFQFFSRQLPQEHKNLVAKKFWVKKVSWKERWMDSRFYSFFTWIAWEF